MTDLVQDQVGLVHILTVTDLVHMLTVTDLVHMLTLITGVSTDSG